MLDSLAKRIFGSQSDREYKRNLPLVDDINRIAAGYESLSGAELQAKTAEFRARIDKRIATPAARLSEIEGQLRGNLEMDERDRLNDELDLVEVQVRDLEAGVLDEIMPEAFALVRESCRRLVDQSWDVVGNQETWFMIPYDVQLFGGTVLHQGKIAEMATGEGKTLVATMPLYLNALPGRGAHLITHNNYLAKRDAMWMGPVYNYLGLSVGVIQDARQTGGSEAYLLPAPEGVPDCFEWQPVAAREAYLADIVYATKDQVGFHYLYDNMATHLEDIMQREFNFAIVDEADSNLIDDARTPLIISGPVPDATNRYGELKPLVDKLIRAQASLINRLIADAEKNRDEADEYTIGVELLKASRGAPKNKRLMKVMQEEGIKRLISRVEADYMRDKRLGEIDEALYYAVDEKSHTIDLTEKGRDLLSPDEQKLFILPDLGEEIEKIRNDESLSDEDKQLKEDEAHRQHQEQGESVHNINQLMRAYTLWEKDVQYMVTDDRKVVIVDESTGRPQPGRRFAEGLHQAIEAKEGVKIEQETQTIATITLQNLFRMYQKLAGMTGTAETESAELWEIYKLDVVVIPTHRPIRRVDQEDQIFRTKREKYNAIIDEVVYLHEQDLPVLVGTVSVEVSELLSRMLTRKGIKHQLLNARYHEKEAQIITQAGGAGTVTIATNMAGRGTDIKLVSSVIRLDRDVIDSQLSLDSRLKSGTSLRDHLVEEPGGLQVIGTERHDSRRIDRQLRGRSGRQGDPGASRFFLALEDDLMRLFGSERIASVMDRLGAEEGEVIEHSIVTRAIGRAQKKVEARNFEIRKHLLEYDDVMNQQRQVIYNRRRDMLERDSVRDHVQELIDEAIDAMLTGSADPHTHPEEWAWDELDEQFSSTFFRGIPLDTADRAAAGHDDLREQMRGAANEAYQRRLQMVGEESFRNIEKALLLHTIDTCWQEHLYEMDELKEGVGFAGVAGKNPLIEYKKGAYDMFESLIERISTESLRTLFQLRVDVEPPAEPGPGGGRRTGRFNLIHRESTNLGFQGGQAPAEGGDELPLGQPAGQSQRQQAIAASGGGAPEAQAARQPARATPKVGRNAPCPCGSGKKYKRCHGKDE